MSMTAHGICVSAGLRHDEHHGRQHEHGWRLSVRTYRAMMLIVSDASCSWAAARHTHPMGRIRAVLRLHRHRALAGVIIVMNKRDT
jgi:hypothetical protein